MRWIIETAETFTDEDRQGRPLPLVRLAAAPHVAGALEPDWKHPDAFETDAYPTLEGALLYVATKIAEVEHGD